MNVEKGRRDNTYSEKLYKPTELLGKKKVSTAARSERIIKY